MDKGIKCIYIINYKEVVNMQYDFELKIIDDNYSIYNCPREWHVDEVGAIFHRVYYVYEGFAIYEDNNQNFHLKKDFIYIFPTNRLYKISHDPKRPLKCLWFHIVMSPVILNPVICYNAHEDRVTDNLIRTIECAVEDCKGWGKKNLLVEQLLQNLIYLISLKEPLITINNENLKLVIDYIHKNYRLPIGNDYLCKLSGYDKSYFIRLFEKVLGTSPQQYLINYRMSKAVTFIRGFTPISEVATKVGYTDAKAFSRAFKRVKGVAPSEYKNSHYLQP
jgi:AraC-like DNA-binding protein